MILYLLPYFVIYDSALHENILFHVSDISSYTTAVFRLVDRVVQF